MKYKFLEHTADIKIKSYGENLNKLFENSLLAFSFYVSNENKVLPKIKKSFTISADNKENLLYKFLEELIYLLDAEDFVPKSAKVKVSGNNLVANLIGDSSKKYTGLNHIKAATYDDMKISRSKKFTAEFILDV